MVNMNLELSVEVKGRRTPDIVDALSEVKRLVNEGFTSGFDENESSWFTFHITEEST